MILPQPDGGVGIVFEFGQHGQRGAIGIDRDGGRAGGIHADAHDLVGGEFLIRFFGLSQGLLDGNFQAFEIIGRVLAGDVVVGLIQNNSGLAGLVIPDGCTQFFSVGRIDNQAPHGIGAVI